MREEILHRDGQLLVILPIFRREFFFSNFLYFSYLSTNQSADLSLFRDRNECPSARPANNVA